VKALFEGIAYEEVPLDSMRRTIATRLVEAKQSIPHFYLTSDIAVGRLIAMREGSETPLRRRAKTASLHSSSRSMISSSRPGPRRCNEFQRRMPFGPAIAFCVSATPISVLRWRSRAV
jgi:hypothetical protein